jgi:hypothetical protein
MRLLLLLILSVPTSNLSTPSSPSKLKYCCGFCSCKFSIHNLHWCVGLQTTELLAPYLPAEGRTVSPYSEGGALFALGLIHASHGQPVVEFISNSLSNTHNEVVQHGASDDPLLYEKLKGMILASLTLIS